MAPKKSKLKIVLKKRVKKSDKINKKKTIKIIKSNKKSSQIKGIKLNLNKLYETLDHYSKQFEAELMNPDIKMEEIYQTMDKVEDIKIDIAKNQDTKLYPSIFHPQFSKLIAEKNLFSIYSIPDKKRKLKHYFQKTLHYKI